MRLDGAIFAIEPRSVGGCIDLAVVFLREHFFPILQLLLWFAVPSVWLTWWLVSRQEWTLAGCLILFLLESPFFGAVLIASAGRRVFGEPFSPIQGVRLLIARLPLIFSLTILIRALTLISGIFFVFPAYLIATRYGFLAEILLLESCPARQYETRLSDLMNETFFGLVGRLITVMLFFSFTAFSLFMLLDLASGLLFGFPILAGRISDQAYLVEEITNLLTRDPRVAAAMVTVAWLVYPVTRLAWLFCYLDVRIRKEGWDLELDFRVEARRLEGAL